MFIKFCFTLSILFIGILSSDIEEAVVEIEEVQGENETPDSFKAQIRNGKLLFSYPDSPIVDMVMQSTEYVPNNGDFFGFLRDSYPLPGGK